MRRNALKPIVEWITGRRNVQDNLGTNKPECFLNQPLSFLFYSRMRVLLVTRGASPVKPRCWIIQPTLASSKDMYSLFNLTNQSHITGKPKLKKNDMKRDGTKWNETKKGMKWIGNETQHHDMKWTSKWLNN